MDVSVLSSLVTMISFSLNIVEFCESSVCNMDRFAVETDIMLWLGSDSFKLQFDLGVQDDADVESVVTDELNNVLASETSVLDSGDIGSKLLDFLQGIVLENNSLEVGDSGSLEFLQDKVLEYKSLVGVDFGLLEFLHDDIPGYNGLLEYNI